MNPTIAFIRKIALMTMFSACLLGVLFADENECITVASETTNFIPNYLRKPAFSKCPRKYILTGGPNAGKTSILRTLEYDHKMAIIEEAAIAHINYYKAQGIIEPWKLPNFQEGILALQKIRLQSIKNDSEKVFLDRSFIDTYTYQVYFGLKKMGDLDAAKNEVSEVLQKAAEEVATDPSYCKTVFLIELLSEWDASNGRYEDIETAHEIQYILEKIYSDLGFNVVKIPAMGVKERAELILEIIEKEGL